MYNNNQWKWKNEIFTCFMKNLLRFLWTFCNIFAWRKILVFFIFFSVFYYYSAFSLICHRKRLTLRVNFSSVFYFKKNLISITCNAFRCIFNYDDANNFFRSIWMKMYCTFVCIYHNMKLTTFQNEHFPKQMHIIIIVATCITYMG